MKHIISSFFFLLLVTSSLSLQAQTWTWEGTNNFVYSFGPNWDLGVAPPPGANVVIPTNSNDRYPEMLVSTNVGTIVVEAGASLTIGPNVVLSTTSKRTAGFNTTSILSSGTITNNGTINFAIGPTNAGEIPLWINSGTFNNTASGVININEGELLGMLVNGIFSNSGELNIGDSASPDMQVGIQVGGELLNFSQGEIQINRSTTFGIDINDGIFSNSGDVVIGNNQPSGSNGIDIDATSVLNNYSGATIEVEGQNNLDIYCVGTINNDGTIESKSSGNNFSMALEGGTLNNDGSATMLFNESTGIASFINLNGGVVNNDAEMLFGSSSSVGKRAIQNQAEFYNEDGGVIEIDRTTEYSLVNTVDFTNKGTIDIGEITSSSEIGILNQGDFTNTMGGEIFVNRASLAFIVNSAGSNFYNITLSSTIDCGTEGLSADEGINNQGLVFNSGIVTINRVSIVGIANLGTGEYNNDTGQTKIGNINLSAGNGIENQGTLICQGINGMIEINRFSNAGILTTAGSTTEIIAGSNLDIANLTTDGIVGITNQGDFTSTGIIDINRVTGTGFNHLNGTCTIGNRLRIGANTTMSRGIYTNKHITFTSSAKVEINRFLQNGFISDPGGSVTMNGSFKIGNNVLTAFVGLSLQDDFDITSTGTLEIDKILDFAIHIQDGVTFSNAGMITIGNIHMSGGAGIQNEGTCINTSTGIINIDRTGTFGIYNDNIFENDGEIIMGATSANVGIDIDNRMIFDIDAGSVEIHD